MNGEQAPKMLYLVRHGLVHNPNGVQYGRLPGFHLSDVGRKEAALAGGFLANVPLEAVWHSPLERTVETARLVLGDRPVPMYAEDLLLEWDGTEAILEVEVRLRTFWRKWLTRPERIAAAVSHRDPIRALLMSLDGRNPDECMRDLSVFPLDTAGVYRVVGDGANLRIDYVFSPADASR